MKLGRSARMASLWGFAPLLLAIFTFALNEPSAFARLAFPFLSLQETLRQSDLRLFRPNPLDQTAPAIDPLAVEKTKNPQQFARDLKAVESYLNARLNLRSRSPEPHCRSESSIHSGSVEQAFCSTLKARWLKMRFSGSDSDTKPNASRSKKEKLEAAQAVSEENWTRTNDYSYRELVGIVSVIPSLDELLRVGGNLAKKSNCVGSSVATALAYKLEDHFPNESALQTAKDLYRYANRCGSDFASATAAYRLSLLEVMANNCKPVPELMRKVESIPDANQFLSRARYWRAYCSEILGDREESKSARELLAKDHPLTFHNLAANAAQPGALDWVTRDAPAFTAFRSLVRPDLNAYLRAFELIRMKKRSDLASEFVETNFDKLQGLEPEVQLYLASALNQDGAILTSFRFLSPLFQDSPRTVSISTMRLFYPMRYFELIQPQSGEGLDPLLVLALVRQESAFNPDARSRVGARGLMQVMPETARMIARVRKTKSLLEPGVNIEVGTKYLRKRLGQFSGDVEFTLAAYNAGAGRVEEWRKRYVTNNKILFIDLIPYRETREYVANILRNYYWYTRIYTPKESEKAKPFVDSSLPRKDRLRRELAIAKAQAGSIDKATE